MDLYNKLTRSEIMRSVKSKDTGAELVVRQILHKSGYRYRLHIKDLPGKPDIVFKGRRKIILVHGCFWHQHPGCQNADRPLSNTEYWDSKLNSNMARDAKNLNFLNEKGWDVLIVWECQTRDKTSLFNMLTEFMEN